MNFGFTEEQNLLRDQVRRFLDERCPSATVREIMKSDPVTVSPETATLDALRLMRDKKVGCLLVVEEGRLMGMVTQGDLIAVSTRLLEDYLRGGD